MLKSKSFLCFDFGAGSLKAAEFEIGEAGTLVLKNFGIKSLGLEGSQETARENVLRKAIQEVMAANAVGSRRANVCATGFHVFSKFVKLPPVDASKVTQIIQYEAQQNVPFPLAEVVWDYQILGASATGEMEVLLVAIKSDVVEGLFRTAEATGLRMEIVDVSPAALCNAFRFNYGDLEGCTMLLDIGAKTSNLLFFEKGKVYARGINIGANSITQDFAAEAKMRFAEAEKTKIAEGFVSLGGAYEEPENPHQAAISKIARQVMTRLHIQVNQTIQFYRGQQGGSAPARLFLAGGGSIMPYTAQFFAEKLNVPVEYFNPFRNLQIGPAVNIEELEKVAHSYGEVVGLGLRNLAQCPVELNLVPKSILQRQQFEQKKPYFIAALISLVLVVFAYGWFYGRVAQVKSQALSEKLEVQLTPLTQKEEQLKKHEVAIASSKKQVEAFTGWLQKRVLWVDILSELRKILIEVEQSWTSPGVQAGVWIEGFGAAAPSAPVEKEEEDGGGAARYRMMDPMLLKRYGLLPKGGLPGETKPDGEKADSASSTNKIAIHFKAVDVNRAGEPENNRKLIYAVVDAIKASPYFDKDDTKISELDKDGVGADKTFTFSMDIVLKDETKAKKGAKK
jgi:type IV pilus assembly protein PilM